MQITKSIKLNPTSEQAKLINQTMNEYIDLVNAIVDYTNGQGAIQKLTSKTVKALLPSACKNQCINDARSIYKKYLKDQCGCKKCNTKNPNRKPKIAALPVVKKLLANWNNQNYKVNKDSIEFPVLINGKSKRIKVPWLITDEIYTALSASKLGNLRITHKGDKYIAQIAVDANEAPFVDGLVMGIDIGLKVPAVCYTDDGKVKFVGNGRKNKYIRRHFNKKRQKLGKAKKSRAIKSLNNKEQRIMKDIDHKISRQIVNYAVENGVSVIRMEELANIRKNCKPTSKSRKNKKAKSLNNNLSSWSFYRLTGYIEYKAKLAGIKVERVNPAYTSQTCPVCGKINHAKDRNYVCECGYYSHRDIVGATNICRSTEVSGKRASA